METIKKMKMKKIVKKARGYLSLLPVFFIMVLLSVPVFAAYDYSTSISVYDNSATPLANVPILVSINNTVLYDSGYITASGLDTDVQESASIPYSVATSRLGIFVDALAAYQSKAFTYFMTFTPEQTSYPLIIGVDGNITRADVAGLELGNNFVIEIKGWIDTDAEVGKNLIYKNEAFKLYVSGATDITADINDGALTATASGVASGEYTIMVTADTIDMKIYVDSVEEDSVALVGANVTDNANIWVVNTNTTMPYIDYLEIWVD